LIGVHQKLDSVQVESAMADSPKDSNSCCTSRREEFELNLRSQRQIRDGKQAHPDITEIDAESVDVR
jgi:hypothetical protein